MQGGNELGPLVVDYMGESGKSVAEQMILCGCCLTLLEHDLLIDDVRKVLLWNLASHEHGDGDQGARCQSTGGVPLSCGFKMGAPIEILNLNKCGAIRELISYL